MLTMALKGALKNQYHAGLTMLLATVEACPPRLWTDPDFVNPFWQVAYHAIFYTDFYLRPSETDFVPWEKHRPGHHRFGTNPTDAAALVPYPVEEIVEYCLRCRGVVDDAIEIMNLMADESGFPWYPIPKLEHQLVNLRHLQHHTGQLADRLRQTADVGIEWRGSR